MKRYCVKRREMQTSEKAYKNLLKPWDESFYHIGITIEIGCDIGNIPDAIIFTTENKEEALEKLKEYRSDVVRMETNHGYAISVTEYFIEAQESNDEYDKDDVEYWEAIDELEYSELDYNCFEQDLIDEIHELMENLEALDADEDAEEIKSIKKELDELKAEVREERI